MPPSSSSPKTDAVPTVLPAEHPSNAQQGEPSIVTIAVNGDPKPCPAQLSLPEFLEHLGINPRLVAVEYNGEILQRPLWAATQLEEGDRLEIVTIVGGG